MSLKHRSLAILFFFFFSFTLKAQIYNVEQRRLKTDTTGWAGNLNFSIAASQYTKSVISINTGAHTQYKDLKNLYLLILNYDLINANGENFDNRAYAHFRYNRKLTPYTTLEYFFQIQNNALVKIRQRVLNGVGPRFKLSDKEHARYYLGIAYMNEYEVLSDPEVINRDHRMSSYFSLTLNSKTFNLVNTSYYQPLIIQPNDFRISNDTNLSFAITERLRFQVSFLLFYDTEPPIEVPNLNYNLRNGLTYKF